MPTRVAALPIFFMAIWATLAPLAMAQEPRLLTPEEHAQWQAIGRVNQAGFKSRSLCTGTLIAPDKVLTAAHCFDPDRSDPVIFVAGWYRGAYVSASAAVEIRRGPGFILGAPPDAEMIAEDWAVLTLESPIADVAPIPFRRSMRGAPVELLAYSGTTPHALSARGPCAAFRGERRLLRLACSSEPGNSGGPVLQRAGDGWHVVGLVSAVTVTSETIAVAPLRSVQDATR